MGTMAGRMADHFSGPWAFNMSVKTCWHAVRRRLTTSSVTDRSVLLHRLGRQILAVLFGLIPLMAAVIHGKRAASATWI
jgi:hypothetical protein